MTRNMARNMAPNMTRTMTRNMARNMARNMRHNSALRFFLRFCYVFLRLSNEHTCTGLMFFHCTTPRRVGHDSPLQRNEVARQARLSGEQCPHPNFVGKMTGKLTWCIHCATKVSEVLQLRKMCILRTSLLKRRPVINWCVEINAPRAVDFTGGLSWT